MSKGTAATHLQLIVATQKSHVIRDESCFSNQCIFLHEISQVLNVSNWLSKRSMLRSQSWCIELRICRVWPGEWRNPSHPQQSSGWLAPPAWQLPLWGSENGVILTEGGFSTPTKEIESQDLLLPDPRSKEVQWAEGRAVFCSTSQWR